MNILDFFQQISRALQLPIAVLPIAALLLRFGQPDLLNLPYIAQAGGVIFANLSLIFAICISSTWAKNNSSDAAISSTVGYLVLTTTMITINPNINMGILAGIITGIIVGAIYNYWSNINFPDFLSFFGGKRFVTISTCLFCLILGTILGYIWPLLQNAIYASSNLIISTGAIGSGIFGLINRLLIPTGLHQILNTIVWFNIGEFTNLTGTIVYGDINRFYAGDKTAGFFMSGFFPIMMFGLPGAGLAIYCSAFKNNRPIIGSMLLSVVLTTFFTGVTEPLEFMFMFKTPLLYLLHAILTGFSMFIATYIGIHAGFSFSAGAIDYVLMYGMPAASNNIWILLFIGVIFFIIYFLLFYIIIKKFNLKTLGREKHYLVIKQTINQTINNKKKLKQIANNYILAIGGVNNIKTINTCITRLRLTVVDANLVNDNLCQNLGALGVIKLNKQSIQIIVGTKAESIGSEIKKIIDKY